MTASTKDLIERLRFMSVVNHFQAQQTMAEAAAALERLTQPGGEVEPVATIRECNGVYQVFWHKAPPDDGTQLCVATGLARIIAERDVARYELDEAKALAKFLYQRSDEKGTAIAALQEQVKVLRELVRNSTEYRLGVPDYELAATAPKEPDNPSDKQWEHAKFVQRVLEAGNEATAEDRAEAYWMVKEFRNLAHAAATPPSDDAMLFAAEAKRSGQ